MRTISPVLLFWTKISNLDLSTAKWLNKYPLSKPTAFDNSKPSYLPHSAFTTSRTPQNRSCLSLHELYVHAGVEPFTTTIILTIPTRINNPLLILFFDYLIYYLFLFLYIIIIWPSYLYSYHYCILNNILLFWNIRLSFHCIFL